MRSRILPRNRLACELRRIHQLVAARQRSANCKRASDRTPWLPDPVIYATYAQEEELGPPPEVISPRSEQIPENLPELPAADNSPTEQWLRMPASPSASDRVQISSNNDLISLTARDAPLSSVLALIAEQHGLNVVTGADVNEQLSVSIADTHLDDALDAILATNGYAWTRHKNIIIVSKIAADNKSSPAVQGRRVEVFTLNYVTATDIDKVVQGLISPVGQSFITQTMPTDHRRTQEQLVVEDLPEYLYRIEQYVAQVDIPPRQVQIEAHVLQVALKDNHRHGVNFHDILRIANKDITFSTAGFASSAPPTSMIRLQGGDLESLIEALQATTDTKTLASPKVTVLNNQEARMQVGAKIGYLLSTTTQTSTLQSVNFLDVGVILTVLPSITEDGQIVVKVGPQVSTGRINPTTQLPESETTEVETQVLLADGEAIVIGGLIKETDTDSQNKIPVLGDLWMVGWLFQRRETTRERNEIIITLVPRIVPDVRVCGPLDPQDVEQAGTPLLYGPLEQVDRTQFEAELPSYSTPAHDRMRYPPPRTGPARSGPARSGPARSNSARLAQATSGQATSGSASSGQAGSSLAGSRPTRSRPAGVLTSAEYDAPQYQSSEYSAGAGSESVNPPPVVLEFSDMSPDLSLPSETQSSRQR